MLVSDVLFINGFVKKPYYRVSAIGVETLVCYEFKDPVKNIIVIEEKQNVYTFMRDRRETIFTNVEQLKMLLHERL